MERFLVIRILALLHYSESLPFIQPFSLTFVALPLEAPAFITGRIVGRNSDEQPFRDRQSGVIGNAPGPNGEIFIRADFPDWALGERMDVNAWVGDKINLSQVIAHEAGHWFGFDHVRKGSDGVLCEPCIMYPSIGGDFIPRWQAGGAVMNPLFAELARKLQ